jgi:hypothetical protein
MSLHKLTGNCQSSHDSEGEELHDVQVMEMMLIEEDCNQ